MAVSNPAAALGLQLERADADLCYCRQRLETEFGKQYGAAGEVRVWPRE